MARAVRRRYARRSRAAGIAVLLAIAVTACGGPRTIPPTTGLAPTSASQSVADPPSAALAPDAAPAPAKPKDAPTLPRVPLFALAHEVPDKLAGLRVEDLFEPARLIGLRRGRIEALLGVPGFAHHDEPAIVWRYTNGQCFLDVFFYRKEGDYVVIHVEARGRTVFRVVAKACFLDLLRARSAGASG